MKGVELPINILVVVAVAVIVLLGLVALYLGGFTPFSGAIGIEGAKNTACAEEVRKGCTYNTYSIQIPDFDADQDGLVGSTDQGADYTGTCASSTWSLDDNLRTLCMCYYAITTEAECRRLCGCP